MRDAPAEILVSAWCQNRRDKKKIWQPYALTNIWDFSLMIMEFTKIPLKIQSKITPFCNECCVHCTGWHLGVFKQVSMPSQCVTHKLPKELSKFFFWGALYFISTISQYTSWRRWIWRDFFGFCLKRRHILTKFELCKKFSALGQNQRDARDYSASGRGCVMRDCRIDRNTTVI